MLILLLLPTGQAAADQVEVSGKIGYVSGNTIYIDLGRSDGISVGDTVDVTRGGTFIGKLLIVNTATSASSCEPLFPIEKVKIGDHVVTTAEVLAGEKTIKAPTAVKTTRPKRINKVRGRIALGSILSEDLTDSGLDFTRPSLSTRIRVNNIAGTPLQLSLRQRSRYYDRESNLAGETSSERWTHKVFELALEYDDEGSPYRIQFGRILPSTPRGLGYIDGALVEYQTRDRFTFGAAGGTRPDSWDAGFQSEEVTFSLFAGSEHPLGETAKASYSAAFVGNYRSGIVNREFFSVDGMYTASDRLSATGSFEIDLNREWKRSGERSFDLTNLFLVTRYRFDNHLAVSLSYDTRRSPRTLDTRAVPDSLFDDSHRKGLHAGVSWTMSKRVNFNGNAGVRFREGIDNTYSASGSVRIREFPVTGVVMNARLQVFQSLFSRGYRPIVGFVLSPSRELRINLRIGDSIYEIGGDIMHNPLIGSSINYWLSRRSFLSIALNGYLSEGQRSLQLFAETGLLF